MSKKEKLRRGDRPDGKLVRDLDSLHMFSPIMLPNRADNEAFIEEQIEIANIERYIEEKNAQNPEHKYTLFHVIMAALARTIQMRPRMNRFIIGDLYYDRNDISFSLIAKKAFSDTGEESIVILKYDPDADKPCIDVLKDKLCNFVYSMRKENTTDNTTDIIDTLARLPRFARRMVIAFLRHRDERKQMPFGLGEEDPYHSTVFLSNLGSIKLNAGYHHLTNWGTNSVFVVVGAKHMVPFYDDKGNVEMRPALNLGITLDERIADGYYYARTVRLLRQLLEQPALLDIPAKEVLDIAY
ncbi:MAG: 2-oxo acid dehydrogenase subunit E2 [Clostridia bacterium]|nr:2-oxo acid dehydrogenase subunit E2 [Clostridia bacterium]